MQANTRNPGNLVAAQVFFLHAASEKAPAVGRKRGARARAYVCVCVCERNVKSAGVAPRRHKLQQPKVPASSAEAALRGGRVRARLAAGRAAGLAAGLGPPAEARPQPQPLQAAARTARGY